MPKLRRIDGGKFAGKAGEDVTITTRSDQPADIVCILYNGVIDGEAPFDFTIEPNENGLYIVAFGVQQPQRIYIVEKEGDEEYDLKYFYWSAANPGTKLPIVGV